MPENIGKLILRVMVGGLMLFHGIYKLQHGIGFIEGLLHAHGAPSWLAYGVYIGEIVAPILLIIGFYSRIWAGVIAVNMLVALWLTHFKGMTSLGAYGAWGAESVMFFLLGSLAIVFIGSGSYAVKRD